MRALFRSLGLALALLLCADLALGQGMLVSPCGKTFCGQQPAAMSPPPASGPSSCAAVTDSDVQAWCNAVTFANTSPSELSILTTMVVGIKADFSITTLNQRYDRLWVEALGTQAAAVVDLAARATLTTSTTAPTFTAHLGWTGNGSSSFLHTGYIASGSTLVSVNNFGAGVWLQAIDSRGSTFSTTFSANDGTNATGLNHNSNTTSINWSVNNPQASANTTTSTMAATLWSEERTTSTLSTLYKAGASQGTAATASAALPSVEFYQLANNGNGTASFFTNAVESLFFISTAAGATAEAQQYARFHTALQALGGSTAFP